MQRRGRAIELISEPPTESGRQPPESFTTTQWTQVLEARGDSPEGQAALSDLCAAYYAPVFAFIRRSAPDEDATRDLTQEFFARLLAGQGIATVDPQRGRFRSFLLGAVKHFLADTRDHDHRLKRGAGQPLESIDSGTDTSPGFQLADPAAPSPEREFDRKWSLTVLGHALATLAEEFKAAGRSVHFETLKPWLTGDAETLSQAEAGRRLGMSEGAVTVAIHRLRRRFRELVKGEIARTLHDPGQVSDELACLVAALGSR
jgi:RNA polymerase sigma factor (sigma-70 family)